MFQTLFGKIALTLFLLFIGLGTALVLTVDFSSRILQEEATQKLHAELAKNITKDAPLIDPDGLHKDNVDQAFHTMMLLGPAIELYLLSPEGDILEYHAPEEKIQRQRVDLEPIHAFLNESDSFPIRGDDPRSLENQKIFSVEPIFLPSQQAETRTLAGYLYIIIGGEDYDSVISMLDSDRLFSFSVSTLVASSVFLILVIWILYIFLTRPIKRLSETMNDFRESDFTTVPASLEGYQIGDKNELNNLYAVSHEMAHRVVCQLDELFRNRKLRQELVTHVSHDLRTPLAGLRGYLETWQIKHDQASNEEVSQFVDSAIKNCDQLSVLVDELFELSRLDGKEIEPNLEPFPLTELVSDIILKFRIKAEQKNITLLFDSSDDPPFVVADIAQVDRVLCNLIENAIRHTPGGGEVWVRLSYSEDTGSVYVSVCDTGCGISSEEVVHLFEPYFQGSNSTGKRTGGNGLGLAISKRLLDLHNRELNVDSTLGKGTIFSFTLPIQRLQAGY